MNSITFYEENIIATNGNLSLVKATEKYKLTKDNRSERLYLGMLNTPISKITLLDFGDNNNIDCWLVIDGIRRLKAHTKIINNQCLRIFKLYEMNKIDKRIYEDKFYTQFYDKYELDKYVHFNNVGSCWIEFDFKNSDNIKHYIFKDIHKIMVEGFYVIPIYDEQHKKKYFKKEINLYPNHTFNISNFHYITRNNNYLQEQNNWYPTESIKIHNINALKLFTKHAILKPHDNTFLCKSGTEAIIKVYQLRSETIDKRSEKKNIVMSEYIKRFPKFKILDNHIFHSDTYLVIDPLTKLDNINFMLERNFYYIKNE